MRLTNPAARLTWGWEWRALPRTQAVILLLLVASICKTWLVPLPSSLWLDETGTVWASKGSFTQVLDRAWAHPGQPSVLYAIVAWLALSTGLPVEYALRLPSLAAACAAAALLYRLAFKLGLGEQRLLAVVAFVTFAPVEFAAADARPYSFALLCVISTVLALINWFESGKVFHASLFVLFAALSMYFHYLCASMLPVYAIYALFRLRAGSPVRARMIVGPVLALACGCAPLLWHATNLWTQRSIHSWAPTPAAGDLAAALLPSVTGRCLAAGLIAAWLTSHSVRWKPPRGFAASSLLFAWYTAPVALLFLMSRYSDAKVFALRYYIWSAPAVALLVGWITQSIEPPQSRRAAVLVIALALIGFSVVRPTATHGGEDWRGIAAAVNSIATPETVLLAQAGFEEPSSVASVDSASASGPGTAPFTVYPVTARLIPLPHRFDRSAAQGLERIATSLLKEQRFLVVTRRSPSYESWFVGRFSGAGFTWRQIGEFGALSLVLLERR